MPNNNIVQTIFTIIVALLIVLSVPALKIFFTNLIGLILTIILLSLIIAGILFLLFILLEEYS